MHNRTKKKTTLGQSTHPTQQTSSTLHKQPKRNAKLLPPITTMFINKVIGYAIMYGSAFWLLTRQSPNAFKSRTKPQPKWQSASNDSDTFTIDPEDISRSYCKSLMHTIEQPGQHKDYLRISNKTHHAIQIQHNKFLNMLRNESSHKLSINEQLLHNETIYFHTRLMLHKITLYFLALSGIQNNMHGTSLEQSAFAAMQMILDNTLLNENHLQTVHLWNYPKHAEYMFLLLNSMTQDIYTSCPNATAHLIANLKGNYCDPVYQEELLKNELSLKQLPFVTKPWQGIETHHVSWNYNFSTLPKPLQLLFTQTNKKLNKKIATTEEFSITHRQFKL